LEVVQALGFSKEWRDWIAALLGTTTSKVLINGEPTRYQTCTGIKAGDPLSPYLFLLCAEAFSALLRKGEDGGLIAGVKICHSAPSI